MKNLPLFRIFSPNISFVKLRTICLFSEKFLSDPGIPGVRSMGPSVSNSLRDVVETIQVIDSIQVIQVIDSIQRR